MVENRSHKPEAVGSSPTAPTYISPSAFLMNIDALTLHWLAGLLEGEGSFKRPSPSEPNRPVLEVRMIDEDIIARVAQIFQIRPTLVPPYKENWKPSYLAKVGGRRGVEFMRLLYPFMGQRRQRQIENALESYIERPEHMQYRMAAKLTEEDVRKIKRRLAAGQRARLIAADFNVTIYTIREISQNKTWKYVTLEEPKMTGDSESPPAMEVDLRSFDWLAGILEAEGSFLAPSPSSPTIPSISISMTDEDIIARVANIFGVKYHRVSPRREGAKVPFTVHAKGTRAHDLMRELYPRMGKRRQAQIDRALTGYVYKPSRTVTEAQAREVKRRAKAGEPLIEIAKSLDIGYQAVKAIKQGRTWKHITAE